MGNATNPIPRELAALRAAMRLVKDRPFSLIHREVVASACHDFLRFMNKPRPEPKLEEQLAVSQRLARNAANAECHKIVVWLKCEAEKHDEDSQNPNWGPTARNEARERVLALNNAAARIKNGDHRK